MIAAGVVTFYILPRHWNGEWSAQDQTMWNLFPYSSEFRDGLKRLIPLTTISSWGFAWGMIGVLADEISKRDNQWWLWVFYIPSAILFLGFIPVAYFVIYRVSPKFLIAPHYRNDIGVTEFRRRNGTLRKTRIRLALILAGSIAFVGACALLGFMNR